MKPHRVFVFLFLIPILFMTLIPEHVLCQTTNYVSFSHNNWLSCWTSGDYVPNDPSVWTSIQWTCEFHNDDDESEELLRAPHLNLTTTTTFITLDPTFNETGIAPGGKPYYLWNYTALELDEQQRWVIEAFPAASSMAPGFSAERNCRPRVVRQREALLTLMVMVKLEESGLDWLHIRVCWWETDEADARPLFFFFKILSWMRVSEEHVRPQEMEDEECVRLDIQAPPTGFYMIFAVFRIMNKVSPSLVRYVPEVRVLSEKSAGMTIGPASEVSFTTLDGSVITFGGDETYSWSYGDHLHRKVRFELVSKTW